MRIAQVAPLFESVPPAMYGGTERVVSYLTEALVELGHDVTLFATGDSSTRARLIPARERSLRLDPTVQDTIAHHFVMMERVAALEDTFDIVHWHCDYIHFPMSRRLRVPNVTTLHGRLDIPDLPELYRAYRDMPVVSISDNQRLPLPFARWRDTVYHGLPLEIYELGEGRGGYLAFVGRTSREKGLEEAIRLAKHVKMPLRIAAKVDKADEEYFRQSIQPLLDDPLVTFSGEIGEGQKSEFYGGARALLFPIDWPEPFGLVMIEAMACGTPVIARRRGSVPEVLEEGVTGFVCDAFDEQIAGIVKAGGLDRRRIRAEFERRFSARRMAEDYVRVYETLVRDLAEAG